MQNFHHVYILKSRIACCILPTQQRKAMTKTSHMARGTFLIGCRERHGDSQVNSIKDVSCRRRIESIVRPSNEIISSRHWLDRGGAVST